jgi:hypothetical protein
MTKSKLEMAMEEFRAYRGTLSPSLQLIFSAGFIGRLLAHIPEEVAVKAIHQSIQAWENHHLAAPDLVAPDLLEPDLLEPVTQEEIYAQMQ